MGLAWSGFWVLYRRPARVSGWVGGWVGCSPSSAPPANKTPQPPTPPLPPNPPSMRPAPPATTPWQRPAARTRAPAAPRPRGGSSTWHCPPLSTRRRGGGRRGRGRAWAGRENGRGCGGEGRPVQAPACAAARFAIRRRGRATDHPTPKKPRPRRPSPQRYPSFQAIPSPSRPPSSTPNPPSLPPHFPPHFPPPFSPPNPPSPFQKVCEGLRGACSDLGEAADPRSWVRLIVEKPFGRWGGAGLAASLGGGRGDWRVWGVRGAGPRAPTPNHC